MGYRIHYRRAAIRYIRKMAADQRRRVISAIEKLGENPKNQALDVKKLSGREGFRLRVGDYRVLFERHDDELVILIVNVKPRGEAYKE